jgi:AcrR family transcriptional regulator
VLAKRLGVTKGSFYWHFKDRHDLQGAVLEYWKDGRIRDIRKQTQASPGAEAEALLHTIEVYSSARNRKGIAIEAAVRDWARRDPQAVAVVEEVDAERLPVPFGYSLPAVSPRKRHRPAACCFTPMCLASA